MPGSISSSISPPGLHLVTHSDAQFTIWVPKAHYYIPPWLATFLTHSTSFTVAIHVFGRSDWTTLVDSHHILYIGNTVILCNQGLYSLPIPYTNLYYEYISDTYQHVESAFVLITYWSITMNNSNIVLCNGTTIYCWAALLISWWTLSWVHINIVSFDIYI